LLAAEEASLGQHPIAMARSIGLKGEADMAASGCHQIQKTVAVAAGVAAGGGDDGAAVAVAGGETESKPLHHTEVVP